ncbi:MAG TPA: acyl-CoA dehydrogenase family protein [Planktothrix sp.]
MNTFLSPAQQAAKEQFEAYVREHLPAKLAALEKRSSGAPLKELLHELGQSGYLGLHVPKEYGGQGQSFLHVVMLVEALATALPALGLVVAEHNAVIETIMRFGSAKQRSLYIPLLARGDSIATTSLSEDEAGSDFEAITTKLADNSITGSKAWVANADIANLSLTSAKDAAGKLRLLLVDLSTESSTCSVGERQELLGMQAVSINNVEFKSHKLGQDACLEPDSDRAREQILHAQDVGKTLIAAAALGSVEAALNLSVEHANQREQFGQKIGQFQGIQWKIADMSTHSAASRMLVYRAAWDLDEEPESLHKDAAMCKSFATRVAQQHTAEAIQILGARGLLADSPAQRFYRDAKVMEICEGTNEMQKIIIGEELGV